MANQIVKLTANIAPGSNKPVAHGLVRPATISLLGFGSGANISRGSSPDGSSAYFTNGGGGNQIVEAVVLAPHSLLSPHTTLISGTSAGAGALVIPHGIPIASLQGSLFFVSADTDANISAGVITLGNTNLTINPTGAGQAYAIFVVGLHSLWGTGQWSNLVTGANKPGGGTYGQIGAGATNVAVPHGLIRTPGLVLLGGRCQSAVRVGSSAADATNIYLSNAGGSPANFEVLTIAGHSIIS